MSEIQLKGAIRTETDIRTDFFFIKVWASSICLYQRHEEKIERGLREGRLVMKLTLFKTLQVLRLISLSRAKGEKKESRIIKLIKSSPLHEGSVRVLSLSSGWARLVPVWSLMTSIAYVTARAPRHRRPRWKCVRPGRSG